MRVACTSYRAMKPFRFPVSLCQGAVPDHLLIVCRSSMLERLLIACSRSLSCDRNCGADLQVFCLSSRRSSTWAAEGREASFLGIPMEIPQPSSATVVPFSDCVGDLKRFRVRLSEYYNNFRRIEPGRNGGFFGLENGHLRPQIIIDLGGGAPKTPIL